MDNVCLCMIVKATKDEAPLLSKCLASVSGYVNTIVIQLNVPKGKKINAEVRAVAEQYADTVYEYEWKGNYVDARNDSFAHAPKDADWILWLDTDDTIENPEQIQPLLSITPKNVDGVYVKYDYDHDEYGNVTIALWVVRAVRNNDSFAWKSSFDDEEVSVHETLIAKRILKSHGTDHFKIVHNTDRDRRIRSLDRNIELLRGMYIRQSGKGEVDPRILFYLATHLYDARNFRQSQELFIEYLKLSGWSEERSEAHVYMGKLLKMHENLMGARTAFLMAIGENPNNPSPYLELGRLDFDANRYKQAVEFLRIGAAIKQELTPMVQFNNHYEIYALLAECLANMGGKELDEAVKWINKALKLRPYDPALKEARERIGFLINYRDNMKAANRLIRQLKEDNEEPKILRLLDNLPNSISDTPPVINARMEYTKPTVWPRKSIAIYTGHSSLGIWGPWSLNEGGIGGSEEAVVRLSDELANLGWKVTVYGTPGERAGFYMGTVKQPGTDAKLYLDGVLKKQAVEWKQYWEFNPKDTFDILISWRQPDFFDFEFNARKKYLWLHDVIPKAEFTKERIANFDRAIFVSQYHANRLEFADIPQSKKFVSSNGITPADFKYDEDFTRDPHKCIYMSANERGLRILYDIWPEVRKAVPDATLDVYYGWQSFDAINRDNPERMTWKAMMQHKARALEGVTEGGRIGQDELLKQIYQAGVWAYPCFFPEVNCITGQKAMAAGAIPVTSDFAALKDLVQYGEQVPMNSFEEPDIERYKQRLIAWLKTPSRQQRIRKDMMAWAREKYNWKHTAEGWDAEML